MIHKIRTEPKMAPDGKSVLADPEVYLSAISKLTPFVENVMQEFGSHLKIQRFDRVLFLFSRVGYFPKKFIEPLMAPDSEMVCVDMFPAMIEYARKNAAGKNIGHVIIDPHKIDELKHMYPTGFSHIVSFLSLQWVKEYRWVLKQLSPLLRENGMLFLSLSDAAPQFDAWPLLGRDPICGKYLREMEVTLGIFNGDPDPENTFNKDLKDAGFNPEIIKTLPSSMSVADVETLDAFHRGFKPWGNEIPVDVSEKMLSVVLEKTKPFLKKTSSGVEFNFNVIHTIARKA